MNASRTSAIVAAMMVTGVLSLDFGSDGVSHEVSGAEPVVGGLPDCLNGFRGCLSGKIVQKGEAEFILQVKKVELIWPNNKAQNSGPAVGKNVRFKVSAERKWISEPLAKAKVGDEVAAGGHHREGNFLDAIEVLAPIAKFPALKAQWEEAARKAKGR